MINLCPIDYLNMSHCCLLCVFERELSWFLHAQVGCVLCLAVLTWLIGSKMKCVQIDQDFSFRGRKLLFVIFFIYLFLCVLLFLCSLTRPDEIFSRPDEPAQLKTRVLQNWFVGGLGLFYFFSSLGRARDISFHLLDLLFFGCLFILDFFLWIQGMIFFSLNT